MAVYVVNDEGRMKPFRITGFSLVNEGPNII